MNITEMHKIFPTEESCIAYLEKIRWGRNNFICPYCGSEHKTGKKQKDNRYMCASCHHNFHVRINTIFQGTQIPLRKWFLALSLVLGAEKGISSYQLARACDVAQPTAWYIMQRIRKAMGDKENTLLQGIIEMDETYVGGQDT